MQKVALALYEYIHKKYVAKMIRRSDDLYSRQVREPFDCLDRIRHGRNS